MYLNGYNGSFNANGPTVYMAKEVMQKLMAYYRLIDDVHKGAEISGLGLVTDWEGDLLVHDFLLFKQEVTGGDTELDPKELSLWLEDMIQQDIDTSQIRLWWHKHPIQGWSSIDTSNIERMNNDNWLLSIVHTPQGLLARIDTYKPFRMTVDNLQIVELAEADKSLDATIKAEIKDKVSRKSYTVTTTQFGQGSYVTKDWNGSKKNEPGPSANEITRRDDYFASLADREWENHYGWETYYRDVPTSGQKDKEDPEAL